MNNEETLRQFYTEVLGLHPEWEAVKVWKDEAKKEVHIKVVSSLKFYQCPVCGKRAVKYDTRERRLRHLDTCDYQTILEVEVPRVKCKEHGVQQLSVSFAEKHSVYTEMFENKAIGMLKTMTTKAVAEQLKLGWDAIDNIKQRAVERGKQRRRKVEVLDAAIDETSFQKGHDYIATVINQKDGTVLDVLPDRDAGTVRSWFKVQEAADFSKINSISMDMSNSFQKAVEDTFSNWKKLICFDRFHVSQLFNKALDKVRRREWAVLDKEDAGNNPLKKKRFGFLKNSGRLDNRSGKRREFLALTRMNLQTCRAWRIKENASVLWNYEYMGAAQRNWKSLLWWIAHCRIPEMIKAGKTIKNHLWGILNAIRMKVNNAIQESTNSSIQRIKKMACGYLNKHRFMTDVLFHFGNLDMAVAPL